MCEKILHLHADTVVAVERTSVLVVETWFFLSKNTCDSSCFGVAASDSMVLIDEDSGCSLVKDCSTFSSIEGPGSGRVMFSLDLGHWSLERENLTLLL